MKAAFVATVALAGLLAGAGEARAALALYDGTKLLGYCESRDLAEQALCAGFIAGAADTFAYATERGANIGGRRTCYPAGITAQQARGVVMRDLRANPEQRHSSAASLAVQALATAFPCR